MQPLTNSELIKRAKQVAKLNKVSDVVETGGVGCALITSLGNVYLGASIDAPCGIGFCAETSAIASMVTNGESRIQKIVAIKEKGVILPPCGRCRELIYEINAANQDTDVILSENRTVKLKTLLPEPWQKKL